MSETPAPPPAHDDPFQTSVEQLASAIEERPPVEVEESPQTRSSRQLYWLIGGLCALTIGAAEIGILLHGGADAPAPPPEVVALIEQDPCTARMVEIMDAVAAYTAAHGAPPAALADLHPSHLPFVPVDPVSRREYSYEVIGESVSLSCPPADAPVPIAAAGASGR